MKVIPAIDIIGGQCVRLTRGDYKLKKVYSDDPLKMALLFEKVGLKRLHLIDLDGAKEGKIKNWETISKIARSTNLEIEFGGGIQGEKDIEKLLGLGVKRVILGSIALKEPKLLRSLLEKFGSDRIIVDVPVKKGTIYFRGWQEKAREVPNTFLKNLIKLGVTIIICTDIERDGALKGPNFSLYKKLIKAFPKLEIIASGGIRNTQDLKKLSKIGVTGTIIGKAIYENKISLKDLNL